MKRTLLLILLGAFVGGCSNAPEAEKPKGDPPPVVESNPARAAKEGR
ncbi:MAG: hypothetical protein ACO1SV_27350 [Fimbriimonas sp.]